MIFILNRKALYMTTTSTKVANIFNKRNFYYFCIYIASTATPKEVRLIYVMNKSLLPEWAPHEMVQLTWPHENTDWAEMLNEVNTCFTNIAKAILKYEPLLIVCRNAVQVEALLSAAGANNLPFGVRYVELPTNDTWARDHGGITVLENGKKFVYDYGFNGWGKKFEADYDNQITQKLFRLGIFQDGVGYRDCNDFILEGGSIESDGEGTLLTTSTCLLSDHRNDMNQEEIEKRLKADFGLKRVLWLHYGFLEGDDTDSHVDTLARFCNPHTIAYVRCDDPVDPHYEELKLMEEELQKFITSDGLPYHLIPLPMADAVYEDGYRLPATYANFLIVNGAVIMPTYNSEKDQLALQQLQRAFPDREVIGVNCNALIRQHGSLHCVTKEYFSNTL